MRSVVVERAALHDRDPHRLEIAGGDRLVIVHPVAWRLRRRGVAFDVRAEAVDLALGREPGHRRHPLHAGHGAEPIDQALIHPQPLIEVRVRGGRQRDAERDQPRSVESGIDVHQVHDRPEHQPRAHHEHNRERHFSGDKRTAHGMAGTRRAARRTLVQQTAGRIAEGMQQRRQAERDAGDD